MLSYLKDGQNQTPAADQMENQNGDDGSLCQQDDFLTVSGQGKKLRQSTMFLAVLFIAAAALVWFMVKKTTPAEASAETNESQVELDAALTQLNSMQAEMNNQMDNVVGKFYQFNNIEQVEVNELKKNPFTRELGKTSESAEDLRQNELKHIRERARQQASELELWSITETPNGKCCMINDKLLYVGDSINEMTVKTIGENIVNLDYNGVPVQLKISE
jgi:preprotein translocase subunit SecG